MSTSEEIQEVYERDIYSQTLQVVARKGVTRLLEGQHGMRQFRLFEYIKGDGTHVRHDGQEEVPDAV